jgi:hypothetical protein
VSGAAPKYFSKMSYKSEKVDKMLTIAFIDYT